MQKDSILFILGFVCVCVCVFALFFLFCFKFKKNFVEVELIFSIVLVSGVQQSESVILLYTYVYSFLDSFPTSAIIEYWVDFPMLHSRSLLAICYKHSNVYMSIPVSQCIQS